MTTSGAGVDGGPLAAGAPLRAGGRGPRVKALRGQLARASRPADGASVVRPHRRAALVDGGGSDAGTDADSFFDEALEREVRAFQQRRGLLADGVVGAQTARALEAAQWRFGERILLFTPGHLMRGDDVAALQERLLVLGLLSGPVDGLFGAATDAALRELQCGLGLTGDGLCGPATLRGLAALARAVGGGDPWALRQQAAVAGAGKSLAGKAVVVDPGHSLGEHEAAITLDLAQRIAGRLQATGVTAVLSRGAAGRPDAVACADLAAQVGADILLSLHCDQHGSPHASGVATYYWGDDRIGSRSAVGHRLASLVQSEIVARTGMPDCRTHPRTFELLRRTTMPAVRVDVGYLSNARDAALLAQPAVRDVVAEAVVVAVQRLYLGTDDASTGTLQLADVLEHAGRS